MNENFYKDPIQTARDVRLNDALATAGGEEAIIKDAALNLAKHYIREGLNKGSWLATHLLALGPAPESMPSAAGLESSRERLVYDWLRLKAPAVIDRAKEIIEAEGGDTRNEYERRMKEKKERLEGRAEAKDAESTALHTQARRMADVIPLGQPILVGHHSEGRDRRYRARISGTYEKSFEAMKKAEDLRSRAASVGKGGVSADNPDAILEVEAKLAERKAEQETYRKINAAYRAWKKNPDSLDKSDLSEKAKEIIRNWTPAYSFERAPIQPWRMSNNNAEIRRLEKRLEDLRQQFAAREEMAAKSETGEAITIVGEYAGASYVISGEDNRIHLKFPGKPSADFRSFMKRHAFKWSPTRGAWVRQYNPAGIYAAESVIIRWMEAEAHGAPHSQAGWSRCPICRRRWLVTKSDDCMVPACDHFEQDSSARNQRRPCEACGMNHAIECIGGGNAES